MMLGVSVVAGRPEAAAEASLPVGCRLASRMAAPAPFPIRHSTVPAGPFFRGDADDGARARAPVSVYVPVP